MPQKKPVSVPDPGRFNLTSFADILPCREPIIGEDAGSYPVFHAGLTQSLAPATPYEAVVAESLICIEWELLQHRRMRDASLLETIREQICKAVVIAQELSHNYEAAQDRDHNIDFDEDAAG